MTARFIRSDAMGDTFGDAPDVIVQREWFQITYDSLRGAPDGDEIAGYDHDYDAWYINGVPYSDIVIGDEEDA
jgi:hypothetical protein